MVLMIVGIVLGALALIILTFLMLPVYIYLESTPEKFLSFYCKILFFKFSGKKKKDENAESNPIEKLIGVSKVKDLKALEKTVKEESLPTALKQFVHIFKATFKQFSWFIHRCTVNKLYIRGVCASTDAAQAALEYGAACAAVYPLVGYVNSVAKVKENAIKIDLGCAYNTDKSSLDYSIVLSVKVYTVVRTMFQMVKEMRKGKNENDRSKQ